MIRMTSIDNADSKCPFNIGKQDKMKKYFLFLILLPLAFIVRAQTSASVEEVLEVKSLEHNFGKIPQGKPVYHFFEVVNKGSKPLKLDNVHASCGCTTPEWSRDEIAPGVTSKIKVGYNAATEGPFEKTITIFYNGDHTKVLRIKGEVWKAPAGAAPSNASVQFLKKQMTGEWAIGNEG
jgi:hypothetical protein